MPKARAGSSPRLTVNEPSPWGAIKSRFSFPLSSSKVKLNSSGRGASVTFGVSST